MELPEDINISELDHFSLFRKGRLEGLPVIDRQRWVRSGHTKVLRGIAMRNVPLLKLYTNAITFNKEFKKVFNDHRMMMEATDSNLYSYDIIVPASQSDSLYDFMIEDLNRYSGFHGRIQKLKVPCLILIRTGNTLKMKTAGGNPAISSGATEISMTNVSIDNLVNHLISIPAIKTPVIDETGYTNNIDYKGPVSVKDLVKLRNLLKPYELDLVEGEREIQMFVITDKNRK